MEQKHNTEQKDELLTSAHHHAKPLFGVVKLAHEQLTAVQQEAYNLFLELHNRYNGKVALTRYFHSKTVSISVINQLIKKGYLKRNVNVNYNCYDKIYYELVVI